MFHQDRGCRDSVMILLTLVDQILLEGKSLLLTLMDYSEAFDLVAHELLDQVFG